MATDRRLAFPPAGGLRTYMMDVDPADVPDVPEPHRLVAPAPGATALTVVRPEDWEPVLPGCEEVRVGTILSQQLMVGPGVEVNAGGRTPCREEHLIVVGLGGPGDRDPVVVCPVVEREWLPRHRAWREGEFLPVLLPRPEYDVEPRLFIWLTLLEVTLLRYALWAVKGGRSPMRLREGAIDGLRAAVARQHG